MLNIFYGFILLFFYFEPKIGDYVIGFVPQWFGYMMLYMGLTAVLGKSVHWTKCRQTVLIMILFSFFEWTVNLFNIGNIIVSVAVKIISRALLMYVNYVFILGIADIEKRADVGLNSKKLMSFWYVLTIVNIADIVVSYMFSNLALILSIAVYAVDAVYMYQMYVMKKLYYNVM